MAIKHVNGLGRVRWQPELNDGCELYEDGYGLRVWRSTSKRAWPVLYRSERRADRVAARENARRKKNNWKRGE